MLSLPTSERVCDLDHIIYFMYNFIPPPFTPQHIAALFVTAKDWKPCKFCQWAVGYIWCAACLLRALKDRRRPVLTESSSLHSVQFKLKSRERSHVHKTKRSVYIHAHSAQVLCKERKEPFMVIVLGRELRGWGPGEEGNLTFYYLKKMICMYYYFSN